MSAHHIHEHLVVLQAERATAALEGLDAALYLDDLRLEIEAAERAYVGAAVTEIAVFRSLLSGRLAG